MPEKVKITSTLDAIDRKFERPGHLVRRLHQICISVFLQNSAELNLTSVQFAVLVGIGDHPGIEQIALARTVALDRQTVSNVVNRLVGRGLVDKQNRDKRSKALFLTPAAEALITQMRARTEVIDDTILAPLTKAQRKEFMALLLKLVNGNNGLSRVPIAEPQDDQD